jgi:hypothetical protein
VCEAQRIHKDFSEERLAHRQKKARRKKFCEPIPF